MPKITGSKGVEARFKRMTGQEKVAFVGQALVVIADEIKAEAAHLITQNSAGGHSGGKHQHIRSRPGQPPNEEFGDLRRGIIVTQPAPLRATVESTAGHAVPLEYGTSNMAARPSMGPAARSKRKRAKELVGKAISIAVRKG